MPPASRLRLIAFALLGAMLAHHWSAWWLTSVRHHIPWLTLLDRWDAAMYSLIATQGYSGVLWAFFPLYPGVVHGIGRVAVNVAPAVVGTAVSSLLLLAFVWRATAADNGARRLSLQSTPWGLFLVLYGPASYVFHSHHTESLFLLLSFVALLAATQGATWTAAIAAGLCIWTRNQGVLVAATVLLLLVGAARAQTLRWPRVASAAALLLAFGLAFLAFEWRVGGHPFAFLHAQQYWTHARSSVEVARTFWLGNPWQGTTLVAYLHHGWFFGALVLAVLQLREERALGAYSCLSFLPMFLQGDLGNVFRFSAVLFPLWFWAGGKLARMPRAVQLVVVVALVTLNHYTARRYARGFWAY